jgi:hypothetical protein
MVVKKKTTAGAGEALRRANRTKGGFLDDVDVEITDAIFTRGGFETDGDQVERTVLRLEMNVAGREESVSRDFSCGNNCLPSDDGKTPSESEEGQFISGREGKTFRGLNEQTAAAQFLDSLSDLGGYDEDKLVDEGAKEALVGVRGHLNEIEARSNTRGKEKKKPGEKYYAKPVPVFTSVEDGTEKKVAKGRTMPAERAAAKALDKKFPKVKEDEEDEAEEVDSDTDEGSPESDFEVEVTTLVEKIAKKGQVAKAKVASAVGKAFEGRPDRMKAVSKAMSDKFLKEGSEAGLWSFEKGQIGPAE